MARFNMANTEGYSLRDLDVLNGQFDDAVWLPTSAREAMSDIELKSWEDHTAERVLADFDTTKA